jgi:thiol-disulfide isomerase/thioredoxin
MQFKAKLFLSIFILLLQSSSLFAQKSKDEPKPVIFEVKTNKNKNFKIKITDDKWVFQGFEKKVIILDFFATWCPPCKRSIPHLNSLRKKFKGKLEILGFDIGNRDGSVNSDGRLAGFIDAFKIKYPIMKGDVSDKLFNGLRGLNPSGSIPFLIIFNEEGKYVKTYLGMISEEQLLNDINYIINNKKK